MGRQPITPRLPFLPNRNSTVTTTRTTELRPRSHIAKRRDPGEVYPWPGTHLPRTDGPRVRAVTRRRTARGPLELGSLRLRWDPRGVQKWCGKEGRVRGQKEVFRR